jgi:hypothetical protein
VYNFNYGYKGEEKLHLGVRKEKRLNTTALDKYSVSRLDLDHLLPSSLLILLFHSLDFGGVVNVIDCSSGKEEGSHILLIPYVA